MVIWGFSDIFGHCYNKYKGGHFMAYKNFFPSLTLDVELEKLLTFVHEYNLIAQAGSDFDSYQLIFEEYKTLRNDLEKSRQQHLDNQLHFQEHRRKAYKAYSKIVKLLKIQLADNPKQLAILESILKKKKHFKAKPTEQAAVDTQQTTNN